MRKLIPVLFLIFTGCVDDNKLVFEKNISIGAEGWFYENPVMFDVPINNITDTLNLLINIRHNKQFQWRNVWVKINTVLPDGSKQSSRVNLKLESAKGQSFGKCTGDICFVQVPIQYNALFPDTGKYTFSIEQSMRVNPLQDIESIGLRLEQI